jgi:hypothetical protein
MLLASGLGLTRPRLLRHGGVPVGTVKRA